MFFLRGAYIFFHKFIHIAYFVITGKKERGCANPARSKLKDIFGSASYINWMNEHQLQVFTSNTMSDERF